MFEQIIATLGVLDTIGFQHPLRIAIGLIMIGLIALLMRRTFVTFSDVEQRRAFERSLRTKRILIFISRAIIVLLICTVFAGPFVTFPELVHGDPRAVVLVDRSTSMENTDTAGIDALIAQLEERVSTQAYVFERSSWDSVRPYIQEGTPLLIASDGMLSGDALAFARYARALNASVNIIDLESIEPDLGVSLDTVPLSAAGVEAPITVTVNGNDAARDLPYRLIVTFDNQTIYNVSGTGRNTYSFSIRPEVGEKTVTAELVTEDAFVENDIAAQTMLVADKPTVHLVTTTPNSPLRQTLSQLYELEVSSRIPDLDDVSALVIDDLPAREIDPHISRLSGFVLDGGGLVVVGGDRSYDRGGYAGSQIESILPVTASESLPGSPGTLSVALIIDVSSSTGELFSEGSTVSVEDVEKSLAVSVYDDLKEDDNVGVIAFNRDARIIQELTPKNGQGDVPDRIRRLKFQGGTLIRSGLGEAARMLARAEGTRYAILFSDGRSDSDRDDRTAAVALRNAGVQLFTVSVGEGSDSVHLSQLARITGGTHFVPGEEDKFEVLFGTNAERPDEPDEEPVVNLVPWDDEHFITSGLQLNSQVSGYNNIVPKRTAQTLVVSSGNQPIVASAFFGLGRIVSIGTDNGAAWSGMMFEQDPELLARTVNYALGDAAKQQDFYVRADDPRGGEPIELLVFSEDPLAGTLSIGDQDVSLSQIDEGEYRGQVELDQGVHTVASRRLIVNYPREYVYPETPLTSVAAATDGKSFSVSDADAIEDQIVAQSYESSSRLRPIGSYFLFAAAIIFLIEVATRRLTERRTA